MDCLLFCWLQSDLTGRSAECCKTINGLQLFLHNRPFLECLGSNYPNKALMSKNIKGSTRPQINYFSTETRWRAKKKICMPPGFGLRVEEIFFIIFIKFRYLSHIFCKSFWKIIKYAANKSEFIFIRNSIANNFEITPLKSKIAPQFQELSQLPSLKAKKPSGGRYHPRWRTMFWDIAVGAEDLAFDSHSDVIGHSVINSSQPLPRFFRAVLPGA